MTRYYLMSLNSFYLNLVMSMKNALMKSYLVRSMKNVPMKSYLGGVRGTP